MPEILFLLGEAALARNDNHERLPAGFEQAGWQVSYPQYQDSDAGPMPSRLEIRRGEVRARFVLGDWKPGA